MQEEGRPGAYCHLARGFLRTFEVRHVFSGYDGFFKFVFSTASLYCSQVCVCTHTCLFSGFVVLPELLRDVSPLFWKPASLHLLRRSVPSSSPPLWTVTHSKLPPCSWVSPSLYIFHPFFSLDSVFFLRFFLCEPFFKAFIEFVTLSLLFHVWFFGPEA